MATRDEQDLSRFGYAQELFRSMGGFSNFAISFSIISILTGAVTLYGYGLEMGGPLEMTLGWPIATIFTLALAASMAELCSAYPTSGAMYHWAAALGGPGWAWLVAWISIAGSIASQAGINYSCAQFVLPFLGVAATPTNTFAMFAFTLVVHALLNHYGLRIVSALNDLSVTLHILGVAVIAIAVFWFAPRQPISFLTQAVNSNGHSPYAWAFLLGLLQAQWTYTGFDASAHMTEETADPRRVAPWGIVLSVAVSGVAGYALLIALTLAIQTIPGALGAKDAQGNSIPAAIAILQTALGAKFGNAMAAMASIAMWFCGLASLTNVSRGIYSLARDNGMPFANWFRRVHAKHGTPGPAIWSGALASMAAMAWSGAVPIVTSMGTVAIYVGYVIPVILGLRAGRPSGPWSLGRWSKPVALVATAYAIFISIVLVMPPNDLAGKTLGAFLIALGLLYWFEVRHKFRGPEWAREQRATGGDL
jgi:amino acid transporter